MSTEEDGTFPILEKHGFLDKDYIKIKDKSNVERLIVSIIKGGFGNLQLIVDFDYTLTRGHFDGEINTSSWGVIDNSRYVPDFYRNDSKKLLEKYYPIEIHANMTEEEKIPFMCEWYNSVLDLLKKCNLRKETISKMVAESNIQLREQTDILFREMKNNAVPVLIFSAGMGDVLLEVLKYFNVYTNNVKVVSNFFKYNDQGILVDFVGDQIHMYNKNENAIHSSDYFDCFKNRSNVILMGDSLGDTKMAVGVAQPNNVLKIGFLNEKVKDRLDAYMDAYDIVLIKDQTMAVVNTIISNINS